MKKDGLIKKLSEELVNKLKNRGTDTNQSGMRSLTLLYLLSVFLLSIFKIQDPDAWMHLSMGRVIWNLNGLSAEPYLYTMADKSFFYNSWLSGLIYYTAYHLFNLYGVILLKAVTVTLAFYVLLKNSLMPYKDHIVAIVIMGIIVIIARPRFVERPDVFLMFFLSFSIFSLNAFVYKNKKYIYALPFIHWIWANCHSSINVMVFPFLSFIIGGLAQRYLGKIGVTFSDTPSKSQVKTIMLIFFLSFAASLFTPYFTSQYTFGLKALTSDWTMQNLSEFRPPNWETDHSPYIITAALIVSTILTWFTANRLQFTEANKGYPSLVNILMVVPFIFLAFTSVRFIFLLAIVAGPILVRNISAFLTRPRVKNLNSVETFGTRLVTVIVAIWIILYTTLTITAVKPFGSEGKVFGFGINYDTVPENALRYMDEKNITGRIFNTWQWGQYISWRDFPKRTVFIDGRGYISVDLLEKMNLARENTTLLNELQNKYAFESILVNYPIVGEGVPDTRIDPALSSPQWALVYWDDNSLLYLRRGGRYNHVIREDEYAFIKPAGGIEGISPKIHEDVLRNGILRELKRNGSSRAYSYLGFIYNESGLYKEAIDAAKKVKEPTFLIQAYNDIAYAQDKLNNIDESINYYEKSLKMGENADTLFSLGMAYIKKKDSNKALKYLKRALNIDSGLVYAYPLLINIYHEMGDEDEVRRLTKIYYTKVKRPDS